MNKKTIWVIVACVSAILIIFPFITNQLMFIKIVPVAGNENTWIGYIGSFGGAIIGGVISGALTLIGVRLTIKDAEKIRKLDEHPKKINNLENLISKTENNLKKLEIYTRVKDPMDINSKDELRLFWIDQNLDIQPTEEYLEMTKTYLNSIKEDVLGIDTNWYREFFDLRKKFNSIQSSFTHNGKFGDLWNEAQDYYLDHFEPLMTWKDYAENKKQKEFEEIYSEIVREEYKFIFEVYFLFSDFKLKAEIYQLNLLKSIE